MISNYLLLTFFISIITAGRMQETCKTNIMKDEQQMAEIDEETLRTDVKNLVENGTCSEDIQMILESIKSGELMKPAEPGNARIAVPSARCIVCRAVLGYLFGRRRLGDSRNNLARTAISLCKLAVPSFSAGVCEGLVNLNIDTILFIIDSRKNINQKSICAVVMQQECGPLDDSLNFRLNIAAHSANSTTKTIPSSSSDIKIVHFTDIHFDPLYNVNGAADCGDPLCCRKEVASSNDAKKAGYWGDYRKCDMPWHTVEQALKHIAEQHSDADFIYYTGDFVPHNVWDTTMESNIDVVSRMYELMRVAFEGKIVYPILGNHEAHPVNVFAPSSVNQEGLSDRWLFNFTALQWSHWLPQDTMETILKGGYYTVLIKPGLRLIALNNNDCYIFNWWIHYSIQDIQEQLQWLHDTLLVAERNDEKVHILAHIPSGDGSCFRYWSREYRRVIERFRNTIAAQFNGHSHYNEFNVFYDTNEVFSPVSVAWNGGSITTYYDVNPNYNVYFVDSENYQVTDYTAWIFNLTEANLNPGSNPQWLKQFSFKEYFKVPDLSLTTLDQLLVDMSLDRTAANQYFQQKFKAGDPTLKAGCEDECLRRQICDITMNEVGDNRRCQELMKNNFS